MSRKDETRAHRIHRPLIHASEAGAIAGEATGAVVGSIAGPPGVIVGMVIGAAAGSLAASAIAKEEHRHAVHDEELDKEIGVVGGDLGAARPAPR
jgi:hypothetical protein